MSDDTDTTFTLPSRDFASLVRIAVRLERRLTELERPLLEAEQSSPPWPLEEQPVRNAQLLLEICNTLRVDPAAPEGVLRSIKRLAETENDRKRIYYLSSLLAGATPTPNSTRPKGVPWLREQLERLFAGKDSVESIAADIEKHEAERAQLLTQICNALCMDPAAPEAEALQSIQICIRARQEATAEAETAHRKYDVAATRYTEILAALEIDPTGKPTQVTLHETGLARVQELKAQRALYHEGVRKYDELLEALGYSGLGAHANVIKYIKLARETMKETA